MISALVSELSGPGPRPDQGHCVASLHPGVQMSTG